MTDPTPPRSMSDLQDAKLANAGETIKVLVAALEFVDWWLGTGDAVSDARYDAKTLDDLKDEIRAALATPARDGEAG